MMENAVSTISRDSNAHRATLSLLGMIAEEIHTVRVTSALDRNLILDSVQELEKRISKLEKSVQGLLSGEKK